MAEGQQEYTNPILGSFVTYAKWGFGIAAFLTAGLAIAALMGAPAAAVSFPFISAAGIAGQTLGWGVVGEALALVITNGLTAGILTGILGGISGTITNIAGGAVGLFKRKGPKTEVIYQPVAIPQPTLSRVPALGAAPAVNTTLINTAQEVEKSPLPAAAPLNTGEKEPATSKWRERATAAIAEPATGRTV